VATSFIGLIVFELDNASAYTDHDVIRIDSDTDFDTQAGSEGWSGNGSEGNPYIIENYDIDGTGAGVCIYIGNTTKHFIIRNCSLHNASGNPAMYYYNSAVMLYNVRNGVVENTTCNDSTYGIYVRVSTGVNITNVTSINNNDGMYLYDSYYVNTTGSDFTSNSNYGLYIRYGYYFKIDNSTFTYSGNDGMQLRYLYYTIIENVTVSDNSDDGLYLYEAYDVTIHYSDFLNNTGDGIYLQEAYTIYVEHNEIDNNDIGIKLYHTSTDYVSYNNITNSTSYGIYDDGYGDNVIHHNNFIDNNAGGVQAYDTASGKNTWNDTNGEGNY
jgi:parallel beta-helix repeat protein